MYHYQNQYYRSARDRAQFGAYRRQPLWYSGLSGMFAYGLNAIGMPPNIVNMGYRFGYFVDVLI